MDAAARHAGSASAPPGHPWAPPGAAATTSSTAPPSVRVVKMADGPTNRREVIVTGSAPGSSGVIRSASGRMSIVAGPGGNAGRPGTVSMSHSAPSTAIRTPRSDGPDDHDRRGARASHEPRDERVGRRPVELVGRADLLQPAAAHDGHAIAKLERFVLLVGHEHRGDPDPVDEIADLVARALAQRGVEVGERLVQQEHARLGRQCAGQRHALLLSARELADAARAETRQIHQRQGTVHSALQVRTPDPDSTPGRTPRCPARPGAGTGRSAGTPCRSGVRPAPPR